MSQDSIDTYVSNIQIVQCQERPYLAFTATQCIPILMLEGAAMSGGTPELPIIVNNSS